MSRGARAGLLAAGVALLAAAGIAAALATAKPASPDAAQAPPRPMLWKVSDADNHLYLLGSFHLLRASDYPMAASVDAALADAERVDFEVSPGEMKSPALAMQMVAAGTLGPGRSLRELVDERDWRRLDAYARRRGIDVAVFRGYEPWFVSLQITLLEFSKLGFEREEGLESRLGARAESARKRTGGLESAASQIALLDGMSPKQQRQFLSETLDDADQFKAHAEALHALWRSGDVPGFEAVAVSDFRSSYPELYQRMLVDRNRNWMPQLQAMLDAESSDDTLVVVGAMHLVGPDGLVSQLKAKGYRVERL